MSSSGSIYFLLAMLPVGETYIELLQGTTPDSGATKWIAENGQSLFHICFEVEDIDSAMAELRAKGIGFEQEKPMIGHGNCRIVFLDPKSTSNLVIELAELPKDGHGQGHGTDQHGCGQGANRVLR